MAEQRQGGLGELARVFLRLGLVGFGGPLATIALIEEEAVRKREWLDKQTFSDMMAAANLIPGPNSTEMAIYVGYQRAGGAGALVAGGMFILPAFLLMLLLSWAYDQFSLMPQMGGFLYGVKPAVIAVIIGTLWRLAQGSISSIWLGLLAAATLVVSYLLPGAQTGALLAAGGVGIITLAVGQRIRRTMGLGWPLLALAEVPYLPLFLTMLKVGALLFGGGLVIVPLLQAEVVDNYHWLTQPQLLDGIALGQATPGPIVIVATFVGYKVAGLLGAAIATLGIFLPAFGFVLLTAPLIRALRANHWVRAFLDAVRAAVVGAITASVITLTSAAMVDVPAALIGLAALIATFYFKVATAWVIIGAGVVGAILRTML